ncbi:hypothetical protein EVAR_96377_1 [Eumeta japonica]|uniref:Uncharacterized protein n=1 Tax=Eumeta variegata TaxID=151549 RepID=A0A4C1WBR8_EUMVA|nr:hypothetical protein EVAR_96377_1 [Eumeta japonica]
MKKLLQINHHRNISSFNHPAEDPRAAIGRIPFRLTDPARPRTCGLQHGPGPCRPRCPQRLPKPRAKRAKYRQASLHYKLEKLLPSSPHFSQPRSDPLRPVVQ